MGPTTHSRNLTRVVKTSRIYLCPNISIPVVSSRRPEALGCQEGPRLPSNDIPLDGLSLFYLGPAGNKVASVYTLCAEYQHHRQKKRQNKKTRDFLETFLFHSQKHFRLAPEIQQ